MSITSRRAGLSADRRALLQQRLAGAGDAAAPAPETITRCAGEGPEFPASFMQEQMWLVTQLEPEKAVYNVPVAVLVRADANVPALERAFSEVVRRHEGLRTVFRLVDGELRQVVLPPFPVPAEVRDERARVGAHFQRDVQRLVAEEGARPMDVEHGPLARMSLLRVSEDECALIITVHHIVTDGWAYPLLLNELWTLYAAYAAGQTVELPPTGLRYADYAVWQRTHLTGDTLRRHVDYWRNLLAGAPETELPGDRPRPARPSYRGAFHHFVIDEATTAAVRALCVRETLTLNMACFATFAALLAHYTGNRDVVLGTLFGNRGRPELQDVVGCFVNSAALRLDLRDDPGLAEASRRARRLILEADAHQELPFEKVVEHLRVERDPSRNPIFQVMYFHHTFVPSHTAAGDGGLAMRPVYEGNRAALVDTGVAKLDMFMATLEDGPRLTGVVEYATDLYDAATMERFCRHFATLLTRAAAQPERPLSQIPLLDAGERRTLIEEWGRGEPAPENPAPLHRRFEARAARAPHAPAVRHAGQTVTFGELNARANRIARRLAALGAPPGARVGVCLERTPNAVAALLGAMKAGAAYVPLDPAYPPARLAAVLGDAGVAAVVTTAALSSLVPAGIPVLALDAHAAAVEAEAGDDLGIEVHPQSPAYVIYTSGSTGTPKGVMVAHRSVAILLDWLDQVLPDDERRVVLASTSFSFDVSVAEVFGTLCAGGTLVLAENALELPADEGVRSAFMVPTAAAELLRQGALPPTLAALNLAGEALPGGLVDGLLATGTVRTVRNIYGPTEATVYATWARARPGVAQPPIGRPVAGARAYVLDAALRPVAVGVPGELFLGGPTVAQGYANRPGLTAGRFVPDPFSAQPGARMYRTGDRARWRADGQLEYRGRMDNQVKLRGFRIELGEVEAALAAQPGVREAAALVHEPASGPRRLAAWVAAGEGVTAGGLRSALRATLPEYMVPSSIAVMDALPRTPSGKLDRRALPAPDPAAPAGGDATAPRTRAEEVLARTWAQVLGRDRVGVHDNFFELGGDSILSIQVIVRAAREGVRIKLRQVFQHQSVAELAAAADTAPPVAAEQGPVTGEAPPTPAQRWMLELGLPRPGHWNMALALEARARLDAGLLQRAADAVAAHHDALRTRFERANGGWRAWTAEPGPAAFDRFDLSAVPDGQVEEEMEARAAAVHAGMELAAGPLFRVALFELGPARAQRVLVAAHHLVTDAVSLPVLGEDLEAAYRQLADGGEVRLPPKTTAFRDWARRLAERARSPEMAEEAAYWLGALPADDAPLPADHANAPDTEGGTAAAFAELTAAETRALLEEVPAAYGTQVNDALLAALAEAFRAWSGRTSLLVDVEGHGREDLWDDVDVSRTVGWFTSFYPVHLRAGADAGATLRGVKETLRAVPQRGIGHGVLRWLGDPAVVARLAARPTPQVSFNYLGQAGAAAAADDGALLIATSGPMGPVRDPRAPRTHRILVEGAVTGGVLRMGFFHGAGVYRAETMERLAGAYADALRALIEHCRHGRGDSFTPADFPAARMDQDELDELLAMLDEA